MHDALPLLQNDPFAILSSLSQLQPAVIAVLTLLTVPGILFLWSWRDRTLTLPKATPSDHGFRSAINLYFFLLPLVNYAIFHYYRTYAERISYLCSTKVLGLQCSNVFAFPPTWSSWILLAICFVLGIVALFWGMRGAAAHSVTTWLRAKGKPRRISWYLFLLVYPLELYIVLSWAWRNICVWRALARQAASVPYNPDQMFGWKPVADLTNYSFLVVALVALLVAVWLTGARLSLGGAGLLGNPGHIAAAIGVLILGPVTVLVPLYAAHNNIRAARDAEAGILAPQLDSLSRAIRDTAQKEGKDEKVKSISETRDAVQSLYDGLQSAATWPVDRTLWDFLVLPFLSPVLLAVLEELAKKFVVRTPPEAQGTAAGH